MIGEFVTYLKEYFGTELKEDNEEEIQLIILDASKTRIKGETKKNCNLENYIKRNFALRAQSLVKLSTYQFSIYCNHLTKDLEDYSNPFILTTDVNKFYYYF